MDNTAPVAEPSPVNLNTIQLRVISVAQAKPLIIQNHYSRKWSSSKVCFGVFENDAGFDKSEADGRLIGVAVYGPPVGSGVIKGISPLLKNDEVLELKRLWVEDGHGKNIESAVIAQSFQLLKVAMPKVKVLVSYADPAAGHHGGIYQATNWLYQEWNGTTTTTSTFSVSLTENPKPQDWIHSRSVGRRFGCHNLELLKRAIGRTFWVKQDSVKYRYLQFLCNRVDRKKILKSLKHPLAPYRKESNYQSEVQEIRVNRKVLYGFS